MKASHEVVYINKNGNHDTTEVYTQQELNDTVSILRKNNAFYSVIDVEASCIVGGSRQDKIDARKAKQEA